nr:GGDEF domain-containing protein [Gemmatimonadaceae bacterium]
SVRPLTVDTSTIPPDTVGWRRWLDAPDAVIAHVGASGEALVARVRVVLTLLLVLVPLASAAGAGMTSANRIGLAGATSALGLALLVAYAVRRAPPQFPLAVATSQCDVAVVSAIQLGYVLASMPSLAVNSRATFACYCLALGATCLRWDRRVTALAGAAAIVQYVGVVLLARARWGSGLPQDLMQQGAFDLGQQAARVVVLGACTALCLAIVQQSSALRVASTRDPMTGLTNRAFFLERVEVEQARARRHGTVLALALLDLDHFKHINDTHGHEVGDEALRAVAGILSRAVREGDLVARWGGEEFAVLLLDASAADALPRIDALRRDVHEARLSGTGGATLTLSLSAGVAEWAPPEETSSLLRRADRALYTAKAGGRNRVVLAEGRAARPIDHAARVG